jgi:ElaA protein
MITFITKTFQELSNKELYQLLQLRSEVFVVEQNCVFLDMDDKDEASYHVLGFYNNQLVAYTRLVPKDVIYDVASIGRVVTHSSVRKLGFGKRLMEYSISEVRQKLNAKEILIGAQLYLHQFYSSLGFIQEGDMYLEDNIEHIKMRLS